MPGLIPDVLPCDVPEAPSGCTGLFDMGERFVNVILDRLEDFVTDDCQGCSNLDGYVSLDLPPVLLGRCNLVAAFLVDYGPKYAGGDRSNPEWMAHWRIQVWEDCYPVPQGDEQPVFHQLGFMHEIHRHLYAHGNAAYSSVWSAWKDPTHDFYGEMYPDCDLLTFGALTPLAPAGPCAGWTFDVSGRVPDL